MKKAETKNGKVQNKLYRSEKNRVIAGVCGGLGTFFDIDPTIVRFIFVLITFFGGGGILLYLVLWLIIPANNSNPEVTKENIEKNAEEIKDRAKEFAKNFRANSTGLGARQIFGVAIALLGILMLFDTLGFVNFYRIIRFIPAAIVILIGVTILRKDK